VLASALLGESPPRLEVRRLVRVAALFGINENQARVALSRMAARGEVTADGPGTYVLAGRLAERAERLAVARSGATSGFDGSWHAVVVTATGDSAGVRHRRREALRAARLAELRDAVWLRPANLALELDGELRHAVSTFLAEPEQDPVELAAGLFDLGGWARRATSLLEELDRTALDASGSLAEGFVRSAEVLRHLQRDPLLPEALLPSSWPGRDLRAAYDAFDSQFRTLLRGAHRDALAAR